MGARAPLFLGRIFRIPSPLSERTAPSPASWPLGWKGVVVHGGGGVAFTETHPLVRHLSEKYCSGGVYSVELPSHGACASDSRLSAKLAKENVYNFVSPIIDSKTIVVAYSVGGMFMSSIWRDLCLSREINPVGIFIGAHPRLVTRWPAISVFWSVPYTYLSQRHRSMQKLHPGDGGEGHEDYWKTTVRNNRDWLHPGSEIQATNREVEFLKSRGMSTQWIIGARDSAFPISHFQRSIDCTAVIGGMERVMKINSTHFDYFQQSWPNTQLAIDRVLRAYFNSELEKS